ncbi:hypothetical protein FO519_000249 [Halicephalobus sp. NKZ332]|nr:hypothetical protein FO519_000249 [Halicephalobus sp. NKZ332]
MNSSVKEFVKNDILLEGTAARLVSRVHIRELDGDTSAEEGTAVFPARRTRRPKINAMEIDSQIPKRRKSRKNAMEWDKPPPESEMDADDENSDIERVPNPKPSISRNPPKPSLPSYLRLRIDEFFSNNSRELKLSCGSQYSDIARYVEMRRKNVKMDSVWILVFSLIGLFLGFILLLFLAFLFILPKRIPAKIKGNHVFITGGSKGIGKKIAEQMILRGAKTVSIAARNRNDLVQAKEYLEKQCQGLQTVEIYELDVTKSYESIKEIIDKAVETSGPVEILINNAGYVVQGGFSEIPVSSFEAQMRINYLSAALVTRAVVDNMKNAKSGHIGFVSSAAGQCAIWGYSAYSPSKFAVRGFAEALHMELLPFNVGVSVLYPPNTETEGFEVEQQTMPEEVRMIGGTAGTFTAEEVAKSFVNDMVRGEFVTTLGLEGKLLGILSSGAAPEPSTVSGVLQTVFAGLFRGIMLVFLWTFNRDVQHCHDKKKKEKRNTG